MSQESFVAVSSVRNQREQDIVVIGIGMNGQKAQKPFCLRVSCFCLVVY